MDKRVFYIGLMLLLISFVLEEIMGLFITPTKIITNVKPLFVMSKILILVFILGIYPYAEKDKRAFRLLTLMVYVFAILSAISTIIMVI